MGDAAWWRRGGDVTLLSTMEVVSQENPHGLEGDEKQVLLTLTLPPA